MTRGGLIAATFTPFTESGRVDVGIIPAYADLLKQDGLRGVFVNGTTGEGALLTHEERKTLARAWVEAAAGELEVFVHVGHASVEAARDLARHAAEVNADAVATLAPYFFKPATAAALAETLARIADAAPNTPFYYYHLPSLTGVALSMAETLPLAAEVVPNLAGVKYTWEDLLDMSRVLDLDLELLFGRDEILLAALALGARGAVGSTYNLMAPLYHQVIAAFDAGDLNAARAAQRSARELIVVALEHGGLPALKALMRLRGLDLGPCRLPLASLTAEQLTKMTAALDAQGLTGHLHPAALAPKGT